MNIKRILIPLLLILLLVSMVASATNVPLGPYFDDTYFDLSGPALILKVVPHEKGGLEADVSAYDGLIKITGGATSNLTIGIADDNIVEMDDADAAVDDYCKLTANGIVGRSYSEAKTDLGIDLSLYYLKTEMDSFSELQAIVADKTLVNTTDKLNVFAAITSAELAGVISDETGSGKLVYDTSPTITTPNIANIVFPATQIPSAGVNTLDDYEEGEWTPTITFGGESVGITYFLQAGLYTKIGRKVTITGWVRLSAKGTSTGAALIGGLPFTCKNADGAYSAPSLNFSGISFANVFQGYITKNATTITLQEITEAGVMTALDNTNFSDNSYILLSATYFTD